jgi:hypothetical protein
MMNRLRQRVENLERARRQPTGFMISAAEVFGIRAQLYQKLRLNPPARSCNAIWISRRDREVAAESMRCKVQRFLERCRAKSEVNDEESPYEAS